MDLTEEDMSYWIEAAHSRIAALYYIFDSLYLDDRDIEALDLCVKLNVSEETLEAELCAAKAHYQAALIVRRLTYYNV